MAVLLVVLSVVALAVGPAAGPLLARVPRALGALDAFVLVTLIGLVALHILPESFAAAGPAALGVAALGLAAPALLHRLEAAASAQRAGTRVLVGAAQLLALCGLAVHALFDGAALVLPADAGHLPLLAFAVVLHRVPVGFALWWVARPTLGMARTLITAGVYVGFTCVGAALLLWPDSPVAAAVATEGPLHTGLVLFQAFIGASLVHVVTEAAVHLPPGQDRGGASAAGAVLGLALLVALSSADAESADGLAQFARAALALFRFCAPALVLGVATSLVVAHAGRVDAWLRTRVRAAAHPLFAATMGAVRAMLQDPAACAALPTADGYQAVGASRALRTAGLLAGPGMSFSALLLTATLLGPAFALLRVAAVVGTAVGAGWLLAGPATGAARALPPARDKTSWRALFHDVLDHVMPWMLVGCAVAAALQVLLAPAALASLPVGAQLALAVLLTAPFPMCASGMTPVAAVLVAKGLSPAAALVGLLLAPMLSATLIDALAQRESRAWSRLLVVVVVAGALVWGAVAWVLPGSDVQALVIAPWIAWPAAALALLWAFTSLWRRGVRGYVAQIVSPLAHVHPGGHLHGPGCTHGCGHDHTPGARNKAPVARIALPLSAVDLIPPRRP